MITPVPTGKSSVVGERICQGGVSAQTMKPWGVIFLCDVVFEPSIFDPSAVNMAKNVIQPGDPIESTNLIASHTMAHELGHLWNPAGTLGP